MYVLCTFVLLSIHSLLKRSRALEAQEAEPEGVKDTEKPRQETPPPRRRRRPKPPVSGSSGALDGDCKGRRAGARSRKKSGRTRLENTPDRSKRVQVRRKDADLI